MKRSQPRRDWTLANAKVEAEDGRCRVCKTTWRVERAHIIGREHDRKSNYRVLAERIVPLCGPPTDSNTCHGKQHAGRLELLPHLTLLEQMQAVEDAGGIEAARNRLIAPIEHRPHREGQP